MINGTLKILLHLNDQYFYLVSQMSCHCNQKRRNPFVGCSLDDELPPDQNHPRPYYVHEPIRFPLRFVSVHLSQCPFEYPKLSISFDIIKLLEHVQIE